MSDIAKETVAGADLERVPEGPAPSDDSDDGDAAESQESAGKKSKASTARRHRTVFSLNQIETLRKSYGMCRCPPREVRHRIGRSLGLSDKVVRVWFQNQRCKDRKEGIITGAPANSRLEQLAVTQLPVRLSSFFHF